MSTLVKPFAALRPGREHAAAVVAPPYDVIDADEARGLAADRPLSFLHISRPEIDLPPGTDPHSDEVYARGAANLDRLRRDGVLVRERAPAFYVYRMTMDTPAGPHTQTGIACVASVRAYERDIIRKHELTRPDKENDRVRNIDSLNAQTGPVLTAYRADAVLRALLDDASHDRPLFEVDGPQRVRHTVWRVDAPAAIERIGAAFETLGTLYIADGHHRSAAAARVAESRRGAGAGEDASHEYFLTVAFPHDEMRILDYNRAVADLNGLTPQRLLERLAGTFEVRKTAGRAKPPHPGAFGMYLDGEWYALELQAAEIPADPVASLDVSLLQDRVISPLLGVDDPRTDTRIAFVGGVRGLEELERLVDGGRAAVAFALHPTRMEQLMAVADAERLMPPKSTWFEPKLADGLLSHVLD
ncbi:MAG: DUF1015 domain-containing protein [Gammaproteobacteria bacterium]|nr:DUF1015 domain-containing protein [Gammaproteobacteria bacterium]